MAENDTIEKQSEKKPLVIMYENRTFDLSVPDDKRDLLQLLRFRLANADRAKLKAMKALDGPGLKNIMEREAQLKQLISILDAYPQAIYKR